MKKSPNNGKLIDSFGRTINYIRFSITDHCNYRCFYCRLEDHKTFTNKEELLSYEEIARIVRIFSELGVSKVRLTGGEPLLRKNVAELVKLLSQIPNIVDIPLSTNAHLLSGLATTLKSSGINRVNISLDSLQKNKFNEITRGGSINQVIAGIDAAIIANMHPVKLNMVVMQGVNDDEIENMINFAIKKNIDIRFIETMPIGVSGIKYSTNHYSKEQILAKITKHLNNNISPIKKHLTAGPATNYHINNTNTNFGIIPAVSDNFCNSCNRVRISAKGRLLLCLGQENSVSLKDTIRCGKNDKQIKQIIIKAIANKPEKHEFSTNINNINNAQMVEIGG